MSADLLRQMMEDDDMVNEVAYINIGKSDVPQQDTEKFTTPAAPAKDTTQIAPPKITISAATMAVKEENPRSIERFFRKNPYFLVPWMILSGLLYATRFEPHLAEYFAARGMEPFGFHAAAQLTIYAVLCNFAVHGWIAVHHDDLVEKGMKIEPHVPYDWKCADAAVRSTLVIIVGMMTYAFVPMRMAPAETWVAAIVQFILGYAALLIVCDASFFFVHYMWHTPRFYKHTHKTHHTWKHPTAICAYYITSGSAMIQEHAATIPLMMFCPVPLSAFLFYQYYGIVGSMVQHCGFSLEELRVPFCGPLKLGHIMTVCGLGLSFVLGGQTTGMHDYHHETFQGNFQLSYSYLDRLFGTYVEHKSDAERGLLSDKSDP